MSAERDGHARTPARRAGACQTSVNLFGALIAVLPAIFARGSRRSHLTKPYNVAATMMNNNGALSARRTINCPNQVTVQIPAHRGQSFRRIADSIPVIADSF